MPFSSNQMWGYLILMCFITGDINFDYLAKVVSTRVSPKLLFFSFHTHGIL